MKLLTKTASYTLRNSVLLLTLRDEEGTSGYFTGIDSDTNLLHSPDEAEALKVDYQTAKLIKLALHRDYGDFATAKIVQL